MAKKKKSLEEISYEEIVNMLSIGFTVAKIASEYNVNTRSLEAKLVRMRDKSSSINNTHLVANYLRKGLIK